MFDKLNRSKTCSRPSGKSGGRGQRRAHTRRSSRAEESPRGYNEKLRGSTMRHDSNEGRHHQKRAFSRMRGCQQSDDSCHFGEGQRGQGRRSHHHARKSARGGARNCAQEICHHNNERYEHGDSRLFQHRGSKPCLLHNMRYRHGIQRRRSALGLRQCVAPISEAMSFVPLYTEDGAKLCPVCGMHCHLSDPGCSDGHEYAQTLLNKNQKDEI